MVVMETVRAATLATARRLERLTTEAKLKGTECLKKLNLFVQYCKL